MSTPLVIDRLTAGYAGFDILHGVSMRVETGLTVLVGPNGAGKTTLMKAISGLIPRQGAISLFGTLLLPEDTISMVRSGLTLVPEGRQLFAQMSVLENLELGGLLRSRKDRGNALRQVLSVFPRLGERLDQLAGTMSGGEQQMLAVARALMTSPRVLMLDEPSLGLAPKMIDELFVTMRRVADGGTSVLMVEQNVRKALAVADRAYVLERGRVAIGGSAAEVAASGAIETAYLGQS